jgi:hypothetical protein
MASVMAAERNIGERWPLVTHSMLLSWFWLLPLLSAYTAAVALLRRADRDVRTLVLWPVGISVIAVLAPVVAEPAHRFRDRVLVLDVFPDDRDADGVDRIPRRVQEFFPT